MKIDPLLLSMGVLADVECNEDMGTLMEDWSVQFLRSGGRLSLSEFQSLTEESRSAFRFANDRIRDELIEAIAERILSGITADISVEARKAGDEIAEALAAGNGT